MSNILVPRSHVHPKHCDVSQACHVEQKQQEWLYCVISDTVVCPRTVVVHFVNTSSARTAMVHSINFYAATSEAYKGVHVYIFRVLLLRFQELLTTVSRILPFHFAAFIHQLFFTSEMLPFQPSRIHRRAGVPVAPKRHHCEKCADAKFQKRCQ